jgi:hypothetical protein
MAEMVAFQNRFRAHFELNTIRAERAGGELTLTIGDERFRSVLEAEREATAREMAEYVRDGYAGYPGLDAVIIRFSHTRMAAVVTTTSTRVHSFSTADLGPPGAAGERNAEAPGAY